MVPNQSEDVLPTDAMEAHRKHVNEEASDELVSSVMVV
jgi:hypothetical protein